MQAKLFSLELVIEFYQELLVYFYLNANNCGQFKEKRLY